ncbi:MAG: methyltransferase domain-containing protein [Candidatus Edwardsbacteria bacterium]|nr:methyltransferase domain-containing protein [Candidatus Edwardsbacteria bacterium]
MNHNPDYFQHEAQYQRKKAKGLNGWNDDKDWSEWRAEILGLITSADFPKAGKVLELGCGAGDVALLFAEKGYQVSGIDIAPTAVEWAREKALKAGIKADFEVGDVTNLGRWKDEEFDIVIDGHCLHCIIGGDRAKVLKETYRVLKPKGVFYVCTMCGEPRISEIREAFDPETRLLMFNGIVNRYLGKPGDIIKELEKEGFNILKQEVREVKDNQDDQDNLLVLAGK